MERTVVLDVVGLSEGLLGSRTPRLSAFCGTRALIEPAIPAVTCAVQATYLTGTLPAQHGIVANGWYFRDLNEVWFWRQSNRLVQGPKLWDIARDRDPSFTCSNTFWWYAMATRADITLTPRPLYAADGLKLPDFYASPLAIRDEFNRRFGTFPLFEFWGPRTSIHSSEWIAKAAMALEEKFSPSLQLVYLPHLDYCLQRSGPEGDIDRDLAEIDDLCGRVIDFFRGRGCRVIVLSEYGIAPVSRPIHPNRILRDAGLLNVKIDLGLEYLDPGSSRAFAVSDHQIAHVYIEQSEDIQSVRELFEAVPGVDAVLGEDGKREIGLDHPRSGELVLLSDPESWFTYYFWQDDAVAPDYARMVDIHKKPGFDPAELFIDPAIRLPMLKVGGILARKALGFRYKMDVTPLDATLVKGSHGVVTGDPHDRPVFASSEPRLLDSSSLRAVDVQASILDHLFRD
jgi:predicted AlkP superfamily pyrophosphatase or phosphodiesterase